MGSDPLGQSRDVNWFARILSECSSHQSTGKGWGYFSSQPVNRDFLFLKLLMKSDGHWNIAEMSKETVLVCPKLAFLESN